MVFAKGRDGKEYRTRAARLRWDHIDNGGDIISFQIIEPQLNVWHDWDCEWNEGHCPLPGHYVVECEMRDGDGYKDKACNWIWSDCDDHSIVKYRILEAT